MLEGSQFQDTFSHQLVNTGVVGIETFSHQNGHITPPLGTFTFWTIVESIAHIHVKSAQSLQPETIEVVVIASESSFWQSIVACLAVHNLLHLHTFWHNYIEKVTIHPTQTLVGLFALTGNVLSSYT